MYVAPCHPSSQHIEDKIRQKFLKDDDNIDRNRKIYCIVDDAKLEKLLGDRKTKTTLKYSKLIGVSQQVLYSSFKGRNISLNSAEKIAKYFKIEVEEIAKVRL